jgi:hypothetical protein
LGDPLFLRRILNCKGRPFATDHRDRDIQRGRRWQPLILLPYVGLAVRPRAPGTGQAGGWRTSSVWQEHGSGGTRRSCSGCAVKMVQVSGSCSAHGARIIRNRTSTSSYLRLREVVRRQHSLRQLAAALNLSRRLTFVDGGVSMQGYLSAIDIFCLPSLQQGLGAMVRWRPWRSGPRRGCFGRGWSDERYRGSGGRV